MKNRQKELIEQMTDKDIFIALLITQCFLLTISAIFVIILFKDISTFFSLFQWKDLANFYIWCNKWSTGCWYRYIFDEKFTETLLR